ncbi:ANKRD50 [Symbiodinium natans]|uniref:ANKRD50 protein n=1 Tax=Symbiodinium natans TaxID=878477 RepID=A0A812KNP2_9DINO|nr:ANKRD50 [Symbiodinium natans]
MGTSERRIDLAAYDVREVSDFDGKFEAKGLGSPGGGLLGPGPVPEVKAPPPPKRPPAPKKPTLLKFEPEMPKYSDKCVGYGDLWKKVQETTVDEAGDPQSNANELETEDEAASGYQDAHPCDLAGAIGGISSKDNGGDGKPLKKPLTYDSIKGCFDRNGKGAAKIAKAQSYVDALIAGNSLNAAIGQALCTWIPTAVVAPFAAGLKWKPGQSCKAGVAVGVSVVLTMKNLAFQTAKEVVAQNQAADCSPVPAMLSRLFCDVHCVRDAVVRGDRTILRNLKKATDITNGNNEKLADWIVKTAQLDAGWLGEKIDHQSLVQSIEQQKEFASLQEEFSGMKELLKGGDKKKLFLEIKQQTHQLESECSHTSGITVRHSFGVWQKALKGYVDGASFSRASTLAANDALEKFVADGRLGLVRCEGKSFVQDGNNSHHVFQAFDSLLTLRSKLRSASDKRSKVEHVAQPLGPLEATKHLSKERAKLVLWCQVSSPSMGISCAARHFGNLPDAAWLSVSVRIVLQGMEMRERHAILLDMDRHLDSRTSSFVL